MAENQNNFNEELDWDDSISNQSSFIEIPDGEYDFMVDHYERSSVGGNGKYAGQSMAVVYCNILIDGEPQLRTNLILNRRFSWKLAQFFISIGLMKDEKELMQKMRWNEVGGARGRLKIENKPNYNDQSKTHPEIVEFLKPAVGAGKWGSAF